MCRHKDIIYENYPLKITFMRVLLLILMLFSGNIILFDINTFLLIAYDAYLLFFFYFVLRFVCKFCYYHGKNRDKGLGKLVKYFYPDRIDDIVLFRKYGNICTILIILIFIIPVVISVVQLYSNYTPFLIVMTILFTITGILYFATQQLISCPHCKMKKYCSLFIENNVQ